MKRFLLTIAITEYYDIIVDASDVEEACEIALEKPVEEVMCEGILERTDYIEIDSVEEVDYIRED